MNLRDGYKRESCATVVGVAIVVMKRLVSALAALFVVSINVVAHNLFDCSRPRTMQDRYLAGIHHHRIVEIGNKTL